MTKPFSSGPPADGKSSAAGSTNSGGGGGGGGGGPPSPVPAPASAGQDALPQLEEYDERAVLQAAKRLQHHVQSTLSREMGFECVFKLRVSKGLRVVSYNTNVIDKSSPEIDLPIIDSDKVSAVWERVYTKHISRTVFRLLW